MRILADFALPDLQKWFVEPFTLTTYETPQELADLIHHHDILLCRSTIQVTETLLKDSTIQCIATATSGTDHIDINYLTKRGIRLFDAKGCNANAVADYVVASVAFLQQAKLLKGCKAGVIGAGEVGQRVIKRLAAAGFEVLPYDPPKAMMEHQYHYGTKTDLLSCDLLCIHANLHESLPFPTKNLLDKHFFSQVPPGIAIINAARGSIVNEDALLTHEKSIAYCTDVYLKEPDINPHLIDFATLCTPHIAGHSIEAKRAAVQKIGEQLYHYYGLPLPSLSVPAQSRPLLSDKTNWQDCVLSLYNPFTDTDLLKSAPDKKQAFLLQRQSHQNRHDFCYYDSSQLSPQKKALLGFIC
ncbi:NAD(P)-dependent oxidoreductase [Legionella nagasakiensis]|uniref:NAD(P)-dependent oxidoreductase n=1 Tax=Legionella nagasakiensis TaxID=535290 RepID=UPI001056C7DD|nr:NAD(P)-dependent oxidoreductase [Legionella nagasakiensis]